ncbi:hypothetical protein BGZ63DRAFT_386307 [Mariannaea sp. PMI_226]|nr:hypothetical protein BGZ63DRAFT_386307 [Mariannaea sp. PMI_226]
MLSTHQSSVSSDSSSHHQKHIYSTSSVFLSFATCFVCKLSLSPDQLLPNSSHSQLPIQKFKMVAQPVPKVLPVVMVVASAAAVVTYVRGQLSYTSRQFDRSFEKYNTPESEANRRAAFAGAVEDPRTNILNVLGWRR